VSFSVATRKIGQQVCVHDYEGCTKLRNEIETQRTKRNETKRNEILRNDRNILKGETKRNATKRNLL
jgi:hypothetical protein